MSIITLLFLFGLICSTVSQSDSHDSHDSDHSDDSHDSHDSHEGHQHESEDIYDCQCTTGFTAEQLSVKCADNSAVDQIEMFMVQKKCDQYCAVHEHDGEMEMEYAGNTKLGFRCFQAFTHLIQYHDYCPSGHVNESLVHHYLEKCPDCLEEHYQYDGAPECDGSLVCTNTFDQEEKIAHVNTFCMDTCDNTDCISSWQTVEGYHRACAHEELSEEFDTLYDSLAWTETVCDQTQIHCNVPEEEDHAVDCSSDLNEHYKHNLDLYGAFDLNDVDENGKAQYFIVFNAIMSVCTVFFV